MHLEKHVAELVEQLSVVAALGGVAELISLLNRVGHDRALVLLAVPWALLAQPAGDRVKAPERLERAVCAHGVGVAEVEVLGAL